MFYNCMNFKPPRPKSGHQYLSSSNRQNSFMAKLIQVIFVVVVVVCRNTFSLYMLQIFCSVSYFSFKSIITFLCSHTISVFLKVFLAFVSNQHHLKIKKLFYNFFQYFYVLYFTSKYYIYVKLISMQALFLTCIFLFYLAGQFPTPFIEQFILYIYLQYLLLHILSYLIPDHNICSPICHEGSLICLCEPSTQYQPKDITCF